MDTIELMWQAVAPLKWWILALAAAFTLIYLFADRPFDPAVDTLPPNRPQPDPQETHR